MENSYIQTPDECCLANEFGPNYVDDAGCLVFRGECINIYVPFAVTQKGADYE